MIRSAVLLLLGACIEAPSTDRVDHIQLEDAVVASEGLTITMASATVDPTGNGSGQGVTAVQQGQPPLEIEAPHTEWDLKARTAVFTGGVVAHRGEFRLRCDELTVVFAEKAQGRRSADQVERAIAAGHVVIDRDERQAKGERAELVGATGEVVLTGSPELIEGQNRLAGTRIVLWLDDDRLTCDACHLVVDGSRLGPQ